MDGQTVQNGETALSLGERHRNPRVRHARLAGEHPGAGGGIAVRARVQREEDGEGHASAIVAAGEGQIAVPRLDVGPGGAHGSDETEEDRPAGTCRPILVPRFPGFLARKQALHGAVETLAPEDEGRHVGGVGAVGVGGLAVGVVSGMLGVDEAAVEDVTPPQASCVCMQKERDARVRSLTHKHTVVALGAHAHPVVVARQP